MSSFEDAIRALKAAETVCHEGWQLLNEIIAYKRVRCKEVKDDVLLRTRALRRMQAYIRRRHELEAAGTVVSAPSVEQIAAVEALVGKFRNMAVEDAVTAAGVTLIEEAQQVLEEVTAATRGIRAA